MGYFGICRENEGSQKVCYKGSKTEDLVLKDIGIQIAEYNQMADPVQFGEKFKQKYRDLQNEVDEELQRRLRCRNTGEKEVCYHERVTDSDSGYLPNSTRPRRVSFFGNRIVLVFVGISIGVSTLGFWIDVFHLILLFCSMLVIMPLLSPHEDKFLSPTEWYFNIGLSTLSGTMYYAEVSFFFLVYAYAYSLTYLEVI